MWADQVDNAVYRFNRSLNVSKENLNYQQHHETWCSFDFGISDPTSIIWYQILPTPDNRRGYFINIIDEYENTNKGVEHYVQVINSKPYVNVHYFGDPSGTARNATLESWSGKFREYGIKIKTTTGYTLSVLL